MAGITARRNESSSGVGLPSFRAAFVGRKPQLTHLRRLLARHRLVTLTGPPGVGKTRLAAEFASQIRGMFADDVCWLDLSEVSRDDQVQKAVFDSLRTTAGEHLAELDLLLVLDNSDRLLDGCRRVLEEILRQCPAVRVLVTSRSALRVPDEQLLPLVGLELREVATATPDQLGRSEAVRFFTDRIRRSDPGFTLTATNAVDVAAICDRLERMPLALELAAPRVRLFGAAELLRRLDDGLDLTSDRVRTSTSWHSSVRAAIDRTHQVLSPSQRMVWYRLSVLPGPFDADLAAAICAVDASGSAAVLSILGQLEAHSLFTPVTVEAGSVALRHWTAARAFARECLDAAGEADRTYERLTTYLVGEIEPQLEAFLIPAGLCRWVVARADHVLAAIDWLAERDDDRLAVLACGLARSWMTLGRNLVESEQLLREALPEVRHRPDLTASLLAALCKAAHRHGRYGEQLRIGAEALAVENLLGRPARIASILDLLAAAHRSSGDIPQAYSHYRRALDIVRTLGDPAVLSLMVNDIAWAALEGDDPGLAHEMLAEGLPLARTHATPGRLASILHTAGTLALSEGDHETAEARFVEALLVTNPTDGLKVPYFAEGIGIVLAANGEGERALSLFACAKGVRHELHAVAEPAWQHRVRRAADETARGLGARRARAASAAGERVGLQDAAEYALNASEHFHATGRELLTHQEHTVAALVTDGLTNQQIARRLGISSRTVATHLERIRAKVGVGPRPALAAWFTRADHTARRG
jgi:non-specific serine/threonine protein kinase